MLQDYGLDGSVANIAVKVDCCEFVSTASFFWSILYTRAVSGISFAGIVSLSRDSLKTNLRSQFAALSLSLSLVPGLGICAVPTLGYPLP